MNRFKKKSKAPHSGATSPSNQSAISLSVPDQPGIRRRVKSWAETLLTPTTQPPSSSATSTPPTLNPVGTPPNGDAGPTTHPTLDPVPNEVTPGSTPIVEKDSAKTAAWNVFRTALAVTKEISSAVPFAQLGGVVGGLIAILDRFEAADGNLDEIEAITRHIEKIQKIVAPLKKDTMDSIPRLIDTIPLVEDLKRDLRSLATSAKNRKDQPKAKRVVGSSKDASIITELNQELDRILQEFQADTILSIVNRLETQAQDELVRTLPRAHNAAHNSGLRANSGATHCLEHTQEATLNTIKDWSDDAGDRSDEDEVRLDTSHAKCPPIFWIWGMAGMGKSTIAQTVAEREAFQGRLGASFMFSRDTKEQSDPLLLFPTLAYQLSHFNSLYKAHLAKALRPNPDVSRGEIAHQLKALLVDPLSACKSLPSPIIIVIDALDECEPESVWRTIIHALAADVPNIRHNVRFLVTSRPENTLGKEFRVSALDAHSKSWKLHELGERIVSRDVERYLHHHLRRIASDYGLPDTWPDLRRRDILAKKSGMFFIVAATLIKFIDDDTLGPEDQLDELTKDSNVTHVLGHEAALVVMYNTIINIALRAKTSDNTSRMSSRISDLIKTVVGTIILVKDPMSNDTLTAFLEIKRVSGALSHLHSLFIVPATPEAPIRVLHQSLPEYLTNEDQCKHLYIDPAAGHARLAGLCFKHLASLERNPCKIEDPASLNKNVGDLQERIDKYIPLHKRYSCLRIGDHVLAASHPNDKQVLATAFATFCESKLLVWIEVLSYLGQLNLAKNTLNVLHNWYSDTTNPSDQIKEIVADAERLLERFLNLIRKGAGHVYLTALPWTAPSALWSQYETLGQELHLPHYPTRDDTLAHLAAWFSRHCSNPDDLDPESRAEGGVSIYHEEAICLGQEVLELRRPDHPRYASALVNLAGYFRDSYNWANDYVIDEAIDLGQQALDLCPPGHPDHADTLAKHLETFSERIEHLQCTWGDDVDDMLSLAFCLRDRYDVTKDVTDLSSAIKVCEDVLRDIRSEDLDRVDSLTTLSGYLSDRYDMTGDVTDLSEAIQRGQEALDLCPPGHTERLDILFMLTGHLSKCPERMKGVDHLSENIGLRREILQFHPPGEPGRLRTLRNLSTYLCERYRETNDIDDLSEVIGLRREVLQLCPPGDPDRVGTLVKLAQNLGDRSELMKDVGDVSEAIDLCREILQLRPPGHPGRLGSLVDLSTHLSDRYNATNDVDDLSETIGLRREILQLYPPGHPDRVDTLVNLFIHLSDRYDLTRDATDLSETIHLLQELLQLHPPGHPDRANALFDLSTYLSERYDLMKEVDDLSEAIRLGREALELRPPGDPNHVNTLVNLAAYIGDRYNLAQDVNDLSEAIILSRQILQHHPLGHPLHSVTLANLTRYLADLYDRTKDPGDLSEAIRLSQEALNSDSCSPDPDLVQLARDLIELRDNQAKGGDDQEEGI